MISGNDDTLDEENIALPRALPESIPRHVQAHLASRSRMTRNADSASGPRTPDERLQDPERLHDKGYLGTREYEAKRTEVIEGF